MAGYVIYERAANPNGAAVVIKIEHCRKRRRSTERGMVDFCGCADPLVVGLLLPFTTGVDIRGSMSSPKVSEIASPELRLIRI
jgi:hypothetical protein